MRDVQQPKNVRFVCSTTTGIVCWSYTSRNNISNQKQRYFFCCPLGFGSFLDSTRFALSHGLFQKLIPFPHNCERLFNTVRVSESIGHSLYCQKYTNPLPISQMVCKAAMHLFGLQSFSCFIYLCPNVTSQNSKHRRNN